MYSFEEIDPRSIDDVDILYKLISARIHNISNIDHPSYEEHKYFVENHPYKSGLKSKIK